MHGAQEGRASLATAPDKILSHPRQGAHTLVAASDTSTSTEVALAHDLLAGAVAEPLGSMAMQPRGGPLYPPAAAALPARARLEQRHKA